jgi:hypothetical protein
MRNKIEGVILTIIFGFVSGQAFSQCSPDLIAPNPIFLPTLSGQCSLTVSPPTTTDFCDGTVVGTTSDPLVYSIEGVFVINWTFTDLAGNSTMATQAVLMDDVTDPIPDLALLPDAIGQCSVNSITPPTATDNCSGTLTGITAASFPITAPGSTLITWIFDDNFGNLIFQSQNVIIADTTAPVADLATLPDVTDECFVSSLTSPTATDNCGGVVNVTNDATFPISTQGTTIVTWTFTDASGNSSTQTQNVVLDDITPPVATVANLTDVTAECELFELIAPATIDNCGGTVIATNDAALPFLTQGTTVVTWTYTDANGNSSTQTQNVVIADTTGPTPSIASLPDVNGLCSALVSPPFAVDDCSGLTVGSTIYSFPITTQGTTVVTWTFTDAEGNTTSQDQNVIIDGLAVTASLSLDSLTITADNTVGTYQWIDCSDNSPVPGATSQSFSPWYNSDFAVIVTEGDCSDTSACETVSTVGLNTLSITKCIVYPNPSQDGRFTINYGGEILSIEMIDVLGRVMDFSENLPSTFVDGSSLDKGHYFVRLTTENGLLYSEVVIGN